MTAPNCTEDEAELRERVARAEADNAALLRFLRDMPAKGLSKDAAHAISMIFVVPHPGAALLERQRATETEREELADQIDREHRAHEQTRQALVHAAHEMEHLRAVELAAYLVLGVCDTPTTFAQQSERLHEMTGALATLRAALGEGEPPAALEGMVADLIMFSAMRSGAQGRDFNAQEAAELIVSWLSGRSSLQRLRQSPEVKHG